MTAVEREAAPGVAEEELEDDEETQQTQPGLKKRRNRRRKKKKKKKKKGATELAEYEPLHRACEKLAVVAHRHIEKRGGAGGLFAELGERMAASDFALYLRSSLNLKLNALELGALVALFDDPEKTGTVSTREFVTTFVKIGKSHVEAKKQAKKREGELKSDRRKKFALAWEGRFASKGTKVGTDWDDDDLDSAMKKVNEAAFFYEPLKQPIGLREAFGSRTLKPTAFKESLQKALGVKLTQWELGALMAKFPAQQQQQKPEEEQEASVDDFIAHFTRAHAQHKNDADSKRREATKRRRDVQRGLDDKSKARFASAQVGLVLPPLSPKTEESPRKKGSLFPPGDPREDAFDVLSRSIEVLDVEKMTGFFRAVESDARLTGEEFESALRVVCTGGKQLNRKTLALITRIFESEDAGIKRGEFLAALRNRRALHARLESQRHDAIGLLLQRCSPRIEEEEEIQPTRPPPASNSAPPRKLRLSKRANSKKRRPSVKQPSPKEEQQQEQLESSPSPEVDVRFTMVMEEALASGTHMIGILKQKKIDFTADVLVFDSSR